MIGNGAPKSGVLLLERPPVQVVQSAAIETLALQTGIAWYGSIIRGAEDSTVSVGERSDAQEYIGNSGTELYSDSWEPAPATPDIVVLDPEVARKARVTAILGEFAALSEELTALWEAGTSIFDPARLDLAQRRTVLEAELTRLKKSSL